MTARLPHSRRGLLRPQSAMMLVFQGAVLALLLERPANLAGLAGLAAAYWLAGGARRWRLVLGVVVLGTWSVVVTQGLFYAGTPRTVWLTLLEGGAFPFGDPPGLYVYREGVAHGLVQSLRFHTVVFLSAGLLVRYAGDELVTGLRALRCPAPLAFLFSLALRFVPLLAGTLRTVWVAQRLRGLRLGGGPPWAWPRRWAEALRAVLLPLLASLVRQSDEIAAALRSRGLSAHDAGPAPATPARDKAAWLAGAGLLAALMAAQGLTRLYEAGIYAHPALAWLYDAVSRYV